MGDFRRWNLHHCTKFVSCRFSALLDCQLGNWCGLQCSMCIMKVLIWFSLYLFQKKRLLLWQSNDGHLNTCVVLMGWIMYVLAVHFICLVWFTSVTSQKFIYHNIFIIHLWIFKSARQMRAIYGFNKYVISINMLFQ